VSTQNCLIANKFEEDVLRNYHEKDLLLRKYEHLGEQLVQTRRTVNSLLELKTKLEGEVQSLQFELGREAERFNLVTKEQMIRMEGLERSLKQMSEMKDKEIEQLRHRIRIYEDDNKRLSDENRTLQMANSSHRSREKELRGALDNLSQIQGGDSQMKDGKEHDGRYLNNQINEQRNINLELQKQIDSLKRKLF
jgi:chromosome segregation ATPase